MDCADVVKEVWFSVVYGPCLVGRQLFVLDVLPQFVFINSHTSTNLHDFELSLTSPLSEESFRDSQDLCGLSKTEKFLSGYI